jgi:hypothetical protein
MVKRAEEKFELDVWYVDQHRFHRFTHIDRAAGFMWRSLTN